MLPTRGEFEAWQLLRDEYLVLLPPLYKLSEEAPTWEQLSHYRKFGSKTSPF
jgi:hypothetical protein